MYYVSMAIAIAGLIVYQISMKAAPRATNPFWLLTGAYLIAAIVCVPAAILWKRFGTPTDAGFSTATLGPAAMIALSVLLIEIGYLLVYRTGWSLSVAPGLAQAVTLSVLFVIGLAFFAEKLTVAKSLGLAMALAGVFLLSRKG
jgi:multidrug transporter EmrE-like cation transporter